MTRRRLGLFHVLFWRVVGVLAAMIVALIAFTHAFYQAELYRGWRTDLRQEAEWTARHWGAEGVSARRMNPESLGQAWRRTHDSVRLTVHDADGKAVIDSHPE